MNITTHKPMTPEETYLAGQAAANFQPGELVKVAFKVPSKSAGWSALWTHDMDAAVGKTGVVRSISRTNGIVVEGGFRFFAFPYFCLERVALEPVKVVLNDTWTAEVISKSEVQVGCQTFLVKNLRSLLAHIDMANKVHFTNLNSEYTASFTFTAPTTVAVAGKEIPVENLRKLLAAADSFGG